MRLPRHPGGYDMDLALPDNEDNHKVNFHFRCNVNRKDLCRYTLYLSQNTEENSRI